MNIVLIHAHDLGRFCEPYGHAIPAPNLMRLAEQGVVFRHCHSASPTCAPSRGAMWTGQHPHVNGMIGLPSPRLGFTLNDYGHHMAAYLGEQGYETAIAGAQHEARAPFAPVKEHLPFEHFLNYHDNPDDPSFRWEFDPGTTVPTACEFLAREHDRPFFLTVGFLDPHRDNRDDPRIFIESFPTTEPADIDQRARYCPPWHT